MGATLYVCTACHERPRGDGADPATSFIDLAFPLGTQIDCGNREAYENCRLLARGGGLCGQCSNERGCREFQCVIDALENPDDDSLLGWYALVPHIKALMEVARAARAVDANSAPDGDDFQCYPTIERIARENALSAALERLDKVRA